jgi:hypothetical protein
MRMERGARRDREGRDDQGHPQGIKAQRKRDLIPHRSLAPVGHSMALGAAGGTSPQHRSALLWGLGQGS